MHEICKELAPSTLSVFQRCRARTPPRPGCSRARSRLVALELKALPATGERLHMSSALQQRVCERDMR